MVSEGQKKNYMILNPVVILIHAQYQYDLCERKISTFLKLG